MAFAGFMRCDELVKLKCADVIFNAEGMGVKIESSKTDQYLGWSIRSYCTHWARDMPSWYDGALLLHGRG